jgi:NTE family protein
MFNMSKAICKPPEINLVLQGGGALGAYQVGAYKAMREFGQEPSVVAGISIGAVNAALIAGNAPENRLTRLEEFWQTITWPTLPFLPTIPFFDALHHNIGVWQALMFGQPNFFKPRMVIPALAKRGSPEATSYEDTSGLKATLERLVDFDLINAKQTRLFLGAVKVMAGEMVFFDNFKEKITVDHVMASGALPPGFPAVRIDGVLYCDGGCYSNTVIDIVLAQNQHSDKRVFMPTLFNPVGAEPTTMEELAVRMQDIHYASRSVRDVQRALGEHNHSKELCQARQADGGNLQTVRARDDERHHHLEIVHVMYRSPALKVSAATRTLPGRQ